VRYEGQTFAADQEASFVIGNPGDTHCGGGVRIQADGSGYICTNETDAVSVQIYRSNGGGSLTGLANITGLTLVSGDRIGLRAIGSTIGLTQNGVVVGSVTDGTYTTGQPGGYGFFNTGDEWQASEVGGATWTAIPGATSQNYTTPTLTLGDDGTQYRFTDTNAAGSVTSNPAALTVTAASTSLTPPLLDSTAVLFAPAVTTGSVPVTPPLLDSAAVLFAPAVSNLAGTEEFAFEDAVFDAGAFDTGGAEEFAFDDGAFDARAFDTGADSTGALTLTPPLLDNSAALFAPAVTTGAVALTPPLLDNSALLFAPTVVQIAPGTQAVSLPLLDNSAALFVPGITTGAVSLTFPLLDSAAVLLAPGITIGGVSLTFPLLDSAASPFAPSITQGPPGNQMLTIPLLSSAAVVFAPSITQTDPPDETAPILSAPTGVAVGSAAGAGTITTDEANGTLYWVTTINAVELEATVQAGLSQSVVAAGVQNVYTPGLTAETAYYHHFVQVDAAGNTSTVVSSGQFTTTAPPAAGQGSSSRMSIGIQIGL
jgi:hypothetical protein